MGQRRSKLDRIPFAASREYDPRYGNSGLGSLPVQTSATSKPEPITLGQAVWVDPGRMSGEPCFRGTRLPVQQLFDWLADGVPLDEFLRDFDLDPRAADTVLRVGAAAVCAAVANNPDCASRS